MAIVRPLKYVGGTADANGLVSDELIQMTDADLAYVRWVLATYWANNEMAGHLRINSAPAGWSSVGAALDTRRSLGFVSINVTGNQSPRDGNPDAEPGYDINSLSLGTTTTTYTFYENFNESAAVATAAQLSQFAFAVPGDAVTAYQPQVLTTQDFYDTIIDDTIQDIENKVCPGQYYLGTSVPAGYTDTGYTCTDTVQTPGATTDTPVTVNVYRLSQLRSTTAPTVVRPLYFEATSASTSSPHLKEMSDTDIINFFLPYLKNRINEGSRLKYTMSTSTTGIDCGSMTDTAYADSVATTPVTKIYTRTISGTTSVVNTYYLRLANT